MPSSGQTLDPKSPAESEPQISKNAQAYYTPLRLAAARGRGAARRALRDMADASSRRAAAAGGGGRG
jgi:hypothetical protein